MNAQKNDFATIFLLEFTKALIENSGKKNIIEITQKQKISSPKEIQYLEKIKTPKKIIKTHMPVKTPEPRLHAKPRQVLTIPKPKLPSRFQNIVPVPTEINIDLGKLNPILQNPKAEAVECEGPNIPLRVIEKTKRNIITKIALTKEEINQIIQTFSEKKKIPLIEGAYRIAAGNLILFAVVSNVVNSRFVIRKMPQPISKKF